MRYALTGGSAARGYRKSGIMCRRKKTRAGAGELKGVDNYGLQRYLLCLFRADTDEEPFQFRESGRKFHKSCAKTKAITTSGLRNAWRGRRRRSSNDTQTVPYLWQGLVSAVEGPWKCEGAGPDDRHNKPLLEERRVRMR